MNEAIDFLQNKNLRNLTMLFVLTLAACAGSPMRVASMSSEELQTQTDWVLCNALANNKDKEVRDELIRRNALSDAEWKMVDGNYLQIGMSELALMCVKGQIIPGVNGSINRSTGSYGVKKQIVYESAFGTRMYIYVENGKVTSWQN